jgi:hypothetical protein
MDDSRQFHEEGVRGGTLSGIPVTARESGLLNRPGFSRHFRASRNIASHTLLAIARC